MEKRSPLVKAGLIAMALAFRSIRAVPVTWTVTWSILGVIAGSLFAGADVPHVPRALGPMLFGIAGALAGSFASLTFLLLRRLPGVARFSARWETALLAVVSGVLATLMLAPVIGVTWPHACIAGGVAGALSGLLTSGGSAPRLPSP